VSRFAEADAAATAFLQANLGVRVLSAVDVDAEPDDNHDGAIAFVVRSSDVSIELALWSHAAIAIDLWLMRTRSSFIQSCFDANLVGFTEPSLPMVDFARRLCTTWIELALGGGDLELASGWQRPRRGRALYLDAKLSQLMSEPIGALVTIPGRR
jgi:hypothetical protein